MRTIAKLSDAYNIVKGLRASFDQSEVDEAWQVAIDKNYTPKMENVARDMIAEDRCHRPHRHYLILYVVGMYMVCDTETDAYILAKQFAEKPEHFSVTDDTEGIPQGYVLYDHKRVELKYLSAPHHGWLRVPWYLMRLVMTYGKDISESSYMDDKYVYLEHDLDANTFTNVAASKGYGWDVTTEKIEDLTIAHYTPSVL